MGEVPVFGLAGLWDAWKARTAIGSRALRSSPQIPPPLPQYTIVCPILQPRNYDEWLNRSEVERPPVHLLRPFDSNSMQVYIAHPKVGNVRNQGPELLNSK